MLTTEKQIIRTILKSCRNDFCCNLLNISILPPHYAQCGQNVDFEINTTLIAVCPHILLLQVIARARRDLQKSNFENNCSVAFIT